MSTMPLPKNHVVIASAGGRKTTFVVEEALKHPDKKILITTYTRENLDQITSYIIERKGYIPSNISVLSLFTFLLREGVWPYQNHVLSTRRVKSLDFNTATVPIVRGGRSNPNWFLNSGNYIYKDRVSEFVCECNTKCGGLVISRLEKIYDVIYIDEMQDLVGWDQELVELIMQSSIVTTLVGDPRQATYGTNQSSKNISQKGGNMMSWVAKLTKKNLCSVEERTDCFRCNQEICNFADNLYPLLPKTTSKNNEKTGHDGIFTISADDVPQYMIDHHNPKILRWNIVSDTLGLPAMNIGNSKGRTFDRVMIFPTHPMKKYLETKNLTIAGDVAKLYVAVTRAKYSVAFVV